jgi:ketosteroid isomerase-like protein
MTGNLDTDIATAEDRLTEATRRVDVDALNRIYADDIIFTGVTGVICEGWAGQPMRRRREGVGGVRPARQ